MADEDGITFVLPKGQDLDRISSCGKCLKEIGHGPYAKVYMPFDEPIPVPAALEGLCEPITGVQMVVHEKCVMPNYSVVESYPAKVR